MTKTIQLVSADGQIRELPVDRIPDRCAYCQRYGGVRVLLAVETGIESRARRDALAICQCEDSYCGSAFVAAYAITSQNGIDAGGLMSHTPLKFSEAAKFSDTISVLSPTFCATYDEAIQAKENGLSQICGAVFRRALEFLVKDYAMSKVPVDNTELRQKIARTLLGLCIRDYLSDGPIQEVAKRAAWLGNDETHYYRTWTEHDISDLKALIQLTVKWIDFTMETDHYITVMPKGRS